VCLILHFAVAYTGLHLLVAYTLHCILILIPQEEQEQEEQEEVGTHLSHIKKKRGRPFNVCMPAA